MRSVPARQQISVQPGQPPTLSITLRPDGCLPGYVKTLNPTGNTISRITISGPGGRRTLEPLAGENMSAIYQQMISDPTRDLAFGNQFMVHGLAAGDYEVTIEAPGYKTSHTRHPVILGKQNMAQIKLEKE